MTTFDPYTKRFAQNQLAQFNRLAAGSPATPTMSRTQMRLPNIVAMPPSMRPAAPTPMFERVARQAAQSRLDTPRMPSPTVTGQTPPQQPQEADTGLMGALRAPLMSPRGQAISQAALAGLEAGGYTTTPTTLGQAIGKMGQAAMRGYAAGTQAQAAQRKATLDEYKIMADIDKSRAAIGLPFKGTSVTAQDRNKVISLAPKILDGTATPTEKSIYSMSYQTLATPRPETRTAPDGTVTTVTVPAMDLSNLPVPEGIEAGEKKIGEQAPKFNNDEKLAAAFSNRMIDSVNVFEQVTQRGYDPSNVRDYAASNLPLSLRATAMSEDGQQYLAAKMNFITAVLRKESGAAISDTEFANEDLKYFPQVGESDAVIEQKRLARQTAINSMKAQSGGAFDYMQKRQEPSEIADLPKGSVFIERKGGISYYRTPDNKVLAVD